MPTELFTLYRYDNPPNPNQLALFKLNPPTPDQKVTFTIYTGTGTWGATPDREADDAYILIEGKPCLPIAGYVDKEVYGEYTEVEDTRAGARTVAKQLLAMGYLKSPLAA